MRFLPFLAFLERTVKVPKPGYANLLDFLMSLAIAFK